ncbi:hypothetical protein AB1L30_21035 [Bremerella sp. JC817]|uniref:hypothetical protein n=1 Tax=Bremerella sp. JC817 TaxID=3231756 RepID=UPI00345955D6
MDENPYQSPATETKPPPVLYTRGYPESILVAQLCGLLIGLLQFSEAYKNWGSNHLFAISMLWAGGISLLATLALAIPHKLTSMVIQVYFAIVAWVSLHLMLLILFVFPEDQIQFDIGILTILLVIGLGVNTLRPSAWDYHHPNPD